MKYNRIFRTLALAVILSLLMMAIPATPALAAESLSVSPSKGEIGDTIDVTGHSYDPGDTVYICFSSEEADVGDDIDDVEALEWVKTTSAGGLGDLDEGDIDTYFKVPDRLEDGDEEEDVLGGDYYVYALYSKHGDIEAVDEFTVIGITIKPEKGPVGTRVEIDGLGFDKNKDIKLEYDGVDIDIASGDDDTDSKGEFTCKIDIPESTAGDHTITAEFGGEKGEAEFTVEPRITISPTSGIVGDEVTVNGTGFGDEVDVYIDFDGDEVVTDETDEDGSFEASFDVPSVGPGTYDVEAEDEDDNSAKAEFSMIMDISISPVTSEASPGNVGDKVTVSGTGFKANGTATINYDDIQVATGSITATGTFSVTFTVPASVGGEHTITATDDTNSMEATFIMESTPPLTPSPLLPLMGDKAGSMAYFDWGDVNDPSKPVTYTLQIASDANFTNKLVNKTGRTVSEYTLTEEEALESTTEEAPYYWRVRAIDAASNASDWTGAGTFYVGFVFELTGWILYALMGLGGILLFFIGLWVGRRGAASY